MNDTIEYDLLPTVDHEKSIQRKRLVLKPSFGVIFDSFILWFQWLFFITAATSMFFIKPKASANASVSVYLILIGLIIDSWLISNVFLSSTLVKTNVVRKDISTKDIELAASKYFPKISLYDNGDNVFRYIKLSGFFTGWYGKIVTVLIKDGVIYLNIQALGRADSLSPFHGLFNYLTCKKIAKTLDNT